MNDTNNNKPSRPRWKNLLFNIIALCIGLIIFGILGEIITRIIYSKGIPEVLPAMFMNEKVTGYRLKPNFTGAHTHRDFRVIYSMDSLGYRDYDHPLHKPAGTFRILVLGDSFTFGVGVPMEDTYPKVLEKMLNAHKSSIRYEVINTGVPGYNTDQEYYYFVKEGISLEPDLVIVGFFGMNDVDGVEFGWQNFSTQNGYLVKVPPLKLHIPEMKGFLLTHSTLARITYYNLSKLADAYHRHGKPRELPMQIYHDNYTDSFAKALTKTEQYLLDMKKMSVSHKAKFILLLIPFEMEVNKKNWVKYLLEDTYSDKVYNQNLLKPSRLFSQFGKDKDISTLDLVPIFRTDHPETCYFTWEPHWNRNGHLLAAKSIYSYLKENRMIPD